jgi:hypothetical protein
LHSLLHLVPVFFWEYAVYGEVTNLLDFEQFRVGIGIPETLLPLALVESVLRLAEVRPLAKLDDCVKKIMTLHKKSKDELLHCNSGTEKSRPFRRRKMFFVVVVAA